MVTRGVLSYLGFFFGGDKFKKNRHFFAFSPSFSLFLLPWWGQLCPRPKYAPDGDKRHIMLKTMHLACVNEKLQKKARKKQRKNNLASSVSVWPTNPVKNSRRINIDNINLFMCLDFDRVEMNSEIHGQAFN